VYELPIDQLIDWETDDDGKYIWAICYKTERKRPNPGASRKATTETFTVWTLGADGLAQWTRYQLTWSDRPPRPEDDVPLLDSGATSFDQIPLYRLELPDGLWVGNKIGPQALEHFRRRSSLIGAQNDSLYAIPYAALGSEFGAPGGALSAERAQNPARGDDPVRQFRAMGALVMGKDDRLEFAEPTGGCYELVDKQLKELRDDMFAVNHQMAASVRVNSTALGRSGLSKQSDKESTSKVLVALGRLIRSFAVDVFRCISGARGDDIHWAAHGMESYDSVDRQALLEEAVSIAQVAIHSPTFRKLQEYDVARKLAPNATPQDLNAIRDEINDGVDGEQVIRDAEHEAKLDLVKNPPPPVVNPPLAPNGKPPQQPKPPSVQQTSAG
jgi:hypothetical protein